jgi:hypothetical protein
MRFPPRKPRRVRITARTAVLAVVAAVAAVAWFAAVRRAWAALRPEVLDEHCSGMDIPVVLLSYNNLTLLKAMVRQLRECFDAHVVIADNGSKYPPMIDYLEGIARSDPKVRVWRFGGNFGPHLLFQEAGRHQFNSMPRFFALSDSDMRLGDHLPRNFLCVLAHLTQRLRVPKAGLALDIADHQYMHQLGNYTRNKTIYEWERSVYKARVDVEGWPEVQGHVYDAPIDTTFAVYDKAQFARNDTTDVTYFIDTAVRVTGPFTAKHRPWYPETIAAIPAEELSHMLNTSWGTLAQIANRTNGDADAEEILSGPRPAEGVDPFHNPDLLGYTCGGRRHNMHIPGKVHALRIKYDYPQENLLERPKVGRTRSERIWGLLSS